MVEIKAADLEVRCFFTWRTKGHNRFYGSVWKMGTGDWTAVGFRLTAARGMVFPKEALDFRLSDFGQHRLHVPLRCPPFFGGSRHHLARWEACHLILSRLRLLANPVRRHPAKSVWTRERMIMIRYGNVTAERRHYNTLRPIGRYRNPQRRRRCRPPERSEHNLPPSGGHNLRAQGACPLGPDPYLASRTG